ncbi:MAG: hypothetical protein ILP07_09310 [Treponema sp.]|nr:hypothetical protein [Treponema sp.]
MKKRLIVVLAIMVCALSLGFAETLKRTYDVSVPVTCSYNDTEYDDQSFSYTYYGTVTVYGFTEENCEISAKNKARSDAEMDGLQKIRARSEYRSRQSCKTGTPTITRQ